MKYLRGSDNQQIILLSDRFLKEDFNRKNSFSLEISENKVIFTGFPFKKIRGLLDLNYE